MQDSTQNIFISAQESPLGMIEINADEKNVLSVWFLDDSDVNNQAVYKENRITVNCKQQLEEYFSGNRLVFDLPLIFSGSDFQHKVWSQLQTIPFGRTISYLQLAKNLGDPKCIRAAASANGKNPYGIIVPCHRVIGSNDDLVGYAGGLWRKRWLLEHEARMVNGVIGLFD